MTKSTHEDRSPRGSKPPYLSLGDAFSLTRRIYQDAGGQASFDLFSKIAGNSPSSSSFIRKINSMKTYGLLNEPLKGRLELSEIGKTIAAPKSPEEASPAKMDSFLRIDVFAAIYDRHKGKLLPADEFLGNIIEQDCGKPRALSNSWISAFKEAARIVGILHDRGDGKIQIMESPILRFPRVASESVPEPEQTIVVPIKQPEQENSFVPLATSGHITKIEISGGRYAAFSVPDRLTKRDAQRLKGALSGLSQIIDSMIEESEGSC